MKNKIVIILISIILSSCAVQLPNETKITQDQASRTMISLVGTSKPDRNLYHTYQEDYQIRTWSKRSGSDSWTTSTTITLTKIQGNYVEGHASYNNNGLIGSYPIFGRYDFTHLYLFNADPNAEWPVMEEFRIDQNGRIMFRTRSTFKNLNGELVWKEEPPYNVDIYPEDRKFDKKFSSTGYISKTDDYIVENGIQPDKSNNSPETKKAETTSPSAEPSLTDKLKEAKELFEEGIISKEEYEALKKKLLEV